MVLIVKGFAAKEQMDETYDTLATQITILTKVYERIRDYSVSWLLISSNKSVSDNDYQRRPKFQTNENLNYRITLQSTKLGEFFGSFFKKSWRRLHIRN